MQQPLPPEMLDKTVFDVSLWPNVCNNFEPATVVIFAFQSWLLRMVTGF